MAEATFPPQGGGSSAPPSGGLQSILGVWTRMSPSLVPLLAVITAMLAAVPLMIITRGGGNIGEGLEVSRIAYTALIEGATGLTITQELTEEDVQDALAFAQYEADELGQDLTRQELLLLAGAAEGLVDIGRANVRRFANLIDRYEDSDQFADDDAMDALGRRIDDIESIGADRLRELGPLLLALDELPRGDVNRLSDRFADLNSLSGADRDEIVAFAPAADAFDNDDLLFAMEIISDKRIVGVIRIFEQALVLDALGLRVNDADARDFGEIYELGTESNIGVTRIRRFIEADNRFSAAGVADVEAIANQVRLVLNIYGNDLIADPVVVNALSEELPAALADHNIFKRPSNQVLPHLDETGSVATIKEIVRDDDGVEF